MKRIVKVCRGLASRPWVCLLSLDSFLSISSASSEPRVQGESRVEMGTGMVLDMVTDAHHDMSGLSGHGMRDEVRKKTLQFVKEPEKQACGNGVALGTPRWRSSSPLREL